MDEPLNSAPCGFLTTAEDGGVLAANATFSDLMGYEPGEFEGLHVSALLAPGGRIFYQTHLYPLLRMQGKAEEVYLSMRTKAGADVPVLVNAVRREREGAVVHDWVVVAMGRRSRFEDELLQAKRAAEEAVRAKGRFLDMMSHDLRTPLSGVTMFAHLLSTEAFGPLTEPQLHALRRIEEATQEVRRLIDDVLSFSRLSTGRVELHPKAVLVADALSRAEPLVLHLVEAAGLEYAREDADPALAVWADPDRLQQVLLNLLTNASKFTAPGGRVSVSAEESEARVLIHVRDTGRGIPADDAERIFNPFVQTHGEGEGQGDEPGAGVGLGLAISRELARAMGGDVTVISQVGEGSTFTIALPTPDPTL